MMYRLLRLDDREHFAQTLAAIRPVTTSQILGAMLHGRYGRVYRGRGRRVRARRVRIHAARTLRRSGTARRSRTRRARAIAELLRLKIVEGRDDTYALAAQRRHPQFPLVDDIIAYQGKCLRGNP